MPERRRAVHASNVFHYGHVVAAPQRSDYAMSVFRRLEFTEAQVRRVETLPGGGAFAALMRRRPTVTLDPEVRVRSLGPEQFVFPLFARLPRVGLAPQAYHAATRENARRVARETRGAQLLHFIEGLGVASLRQRCAETTVMERGNLHHEVFEADIEVHGGFPFTLTPDPLRDVLEEEYASSDRILTYSDVARNSFLERGHPPGKLWNCDFPSVVYRRAETSTSSSCSTLAAETPTRASTSPSKPLCGSVPRRYAWSWLSR